MMKHILYLPLDERPCNMIFPQQMVDALGDISLIAPPPSIMGQKKTPGDTNAIRQWIIDHAPQCDGMVLSIDTLVYGGIVPSRLHHMTLVQCRERLNLLDDLRQQYPALPIYAFNLIMRIPGYSSDVEEPDYYAQFGREIFEISWFSDKKDITGLTDDEQVQLDQLHQQVPTRFVSDFTNRRAINHQVNALLIDKVKRGIVDFMVIPLDDCAQYGWSSMEQRRIRSKVAQLQLQDQVYLYPGADEVGCVLTSRMVCHARGVMPNVYIQYASHHGPGLIPKYENAPLGETLRWHVLSAGGCVVNQLADADWILAVNAPAVGGTDMAEVATPMTERHSAYHARCLPAFADTITRLSQEKPVALADVAFANGADAELLEMLSRRQGLDKLCAYGGWNTSSNAAGTCIAAAMVAYSLPPLRNPFVLLRLIEDWGYMAHVRQQVTTDLADRLLPGNHVTDCEADAAQQVIDGLNAFISSHLTGLNPGRIHTVHFPWHRMFEIGFSLEL